MDAPEPRPTEVSVRQFVPTAEAQAVFASAPAVDWGEVRADLDMMIDDDLRDPFDGTGL
ncbi:hypothetical protein ACQP2T_15450 [Nonomuraea sp. CA-143628]|uniref:hypothetical protein n=1 Tax=Nonomuraea sp. CA-143628 TaxID=3239997 RepID=UPI003D93A519